MCCSATFGNHSVVVFWLKIKMQILPIFTRVYSYSWLSLLPKSYLYTYSLKYDFIQHRQLDALWLPMKTSELTNQGKKQTLIVLEMQYMLFVCRTVKDTSYSDSLVVFILYLCCNLYLHIYPSSPLYLLISYFFYVCIYIHLLLCIYWAYISSFICIFMC